MIAPRFQTVVLDADSTLSGLEGIDWLAERRSQELARKVAAVTEEAMSGRIAIEEVYAERVNAVKPTQQEIEDLSRAYIAAVAPGARDCVAEMIYAGVRVLLLSGGFREALVPLASHVGISDDDVYAVPVKFGADGSFASFDVTSPLTRGDGKARVLAKLIGGLPRPILHVGDGMTDAVARGVVDSFAAFVGYTRRATVVARADFVVDSFAELRSLVLAADSD